MSVVRLFHLTRVSRFLANERVGKGAVTVVPVESVCRCLDVVRSAKTLTHFNAVLVRHPVVAGLSAVIVKLGPS